MVSFFQPFGEFRTENGSLWCCAEPSSSGNTTWTVRPVSAKAAVDCNWVQIDMVSMKFTKNQHFVKQLRVRKQKTFIRAGQTLIHEKLWNLRLKVYSKWKNIPCKILNFFIYLSFIVKTSVKWCFWISQLLFCFSTKKKCEKTNTFKAWGPDVKAVFTHIMLDTIYT